MYNTAYPYYGQPYHTYIPPGYRASGHAASTDPWTREKHTFPQPNPTRQSPSKDPPFIPQNPDTLDAGHTPKPRSRRISATRPVPVSEKPPLKSALKKKPARLPDTVSATPLQRTRSSSSARQRLAPTTRAHSNSNPSFLPDHLFVSFHGTNELRLGNVAYQDTLDEIKEHIIPMWPHGVSSQMTSPLSWRVSFSRNPWNATGSDAIIIKRMISELFACLCRRGYQYLTSLRSGYAYPQLVFRDTTEDADTDFFVAFMSRSGHKLTLVRPPRRVGEQLGPRLRTAWPYKIAAQSASVEEIYCVELMRNAFGGCVHLNNRPLKDFSSSPSTAPELDKDVFTSHALQEISLLGYELEATVSLPRSGFLGFGGKKEIWVFRGARMRHRADSRSAASGRT